MREGERILDSRRTSLRQPTPRDLGARERNIFQARREANPQPLQVPSLNELLQGDSDTETRRTIEESINVAKICNNPVCLKVVMKDDNPPLRMLGCSGCSVATYCSVSCQNDETYETHSAQLR